MAESSRKFNCRCDWGFQPQSLGRLNARTTVAGSPSHEKPETGNLQVSVFAAVNRCRGNYDTLLDIRITCMSHILTVRSRLLFYGCILLLVATATGQLCAQDADHISGVGPVHRSIQPDWNSNVPLIGMQCAIAVWVFILGSCFGSFLNVVIYRLPAGMSLGRPKSRCPQCKTQLAVKDNIPVLGWLLLRGKCRYCSLPIPLRYPSIETLCGGILLVMMFAELLTGAANLPMRHPDHFHINPAFWLVWFMKWDLLGIYLYHCCLLITVLAAVMIGYDGHRPQSKLTTFGLVVGFVAASFSQELRPVPAMPYADFMTRMQWGFWWTDSWFNPGARIWTGVTAMGICDGLAGVVCGLLAGWLVRWQMSKAVDEVGGASSIAAISSALLIVGGFLGWQACGMLTLIILPLLVVCRFLDRSDSEQRFQRLSAPGFFVVLFAFLLLWKRLDEAVWCIGYDGWDFTAISWPIDWAITLVLLFAFASVVRFCLSKHETASTATGFPPGDEPR